MEMEVGAETSEENNINNFRVSRLRYWSDGIPDETETTTVIETL